MSFSSFDCAEFHAFGGQSNNVADDSLNALGQIIESIQLSADSFLYKQVGSLKWFAKINFFRKMRQPAFHAVFQFLSNLCFGSNQCIFMKVALFATSVVLHLTVDVLSVTVASIAKNIIPGKFSVKSLIYELLGTVVPVVIRTFCQVIWFTN